MARWYKGTLKLLRLPACMLHCNVGGRWRGNWTLRLLDISPTAWTVRLQIAHFAYKAARIKLSKCLYTRPAVWCSTTVDYTHGPKIIKHATLLFLSFSYAPIRHSLFFIYPHKKPLSMVKYLLLFRYCLYVHGAFTRINSIGNELSL